MLPCILTRFSSHNFFIMKNQKFTQLFNILYSIDQQISTNGSIFMDFRRREKDSSDDCNVLPFDQYSIKKFSSLLHMSYQIHIPFFFGYSFGVHCTQYKLTLRFFFKFVSRANCSNSYPPTKWPRKQKM